MTYLNQGLLDLPNSLLRSNRELEVLLGDGIPVLNRQQISWHKSESRTYLVHHHDRQQHAQTEEEDAVNVMTDGIANTSRECEEQHAADNVECDTENNVSNDPSIVQRANDEDKLRNGVEDDADSGEDEVGDKEPDGAGVGEGGPFFEGRDGDKESHSPDEETGDAKKLRGQQ